MNKQNALKLLRDALAEITMPDGTAATDYFNSLREVDAKIRDVRMVLEVVDDLPPSLLTRMNEDFDFQANSRRIRLESLANYVRSAVKFVDTGAFEKPVRTIHAAPNFTKIALAVPGLKEELERRWKEAQECIHVHAYTAAVVMMGSVLEGLLLARAQSSTSIAYQSSRAPKDKSGKGIALHDWSLSALIDVAADVGWIKVDRAKFSHALRESRNVVHPWNAVLNKANFDQATCETSWLVLVSSSEDLIASHA